MKTTRDVFEEIVIDILMAESEDQLYPCQVNSCNTLAENVRRLKQTIKDCKIFS